MKKKFINYRAGAARINTRTLEDLQAMAIASVIRTRTINAPATSEDTAIMADLGFAVGLGRTKPTEVIYIVQEWSERNVEIVHERFASLAELCGFVQDYYDVDISEAAVDAR